MAKTVPLDAATLAWARTVFADYYQRTAIPPPDRLPRREFAAFPFATETFMRRHATLPSPEAFRSFLTTEVPRHVYYSSAYYRHPAEPRMDAKQWLGADLIFDLDSDHLRGAETLRYDEQLALVKRKLVALLDDFLFGDFGIDPKDAAIVFSGGRGYHVHVRGEGFVSLSSPERRELVDYVLGTGVEPLRAVRTREQTQDVPVGGDGEEPVPRGRRAGVPRARYLVRPDAPGWPGRTTRAVLELLDRWETIGPKAAAAELERAGIPAAKARSWSRALLDGAAKIRATGTLEVFPKEVPEELLAAVLPRAAVELQGETDAPVTTDIHRLIRLPGSIHGGTGLRVVPLSRRELDTFDPFRDALLGPLNGARTTVRYTEEVAHPFPGGLTGRRDEVVSLPTPLALFLVLRGQAELPTSPA